jgi:quercetin dioxygenase-like cupin family protein
MPLEVVSLNAAADLLERPFAVVSLASVGDLSLSLYMCQGQINWHRHPDEDELFLVHEGVVRLDTERGRLTLHSEELAVVPKGVGHRSSSQLRSVVILIRPTVLTDRKNGHRHFSVDTDPPIEKVRLARVQATLGAPYRAAAVARVEDFDLLLMTATGDSPPQPAADHHVLWLALRGQVTVSVPGQPPAHLAAGELVTLAPGTAHHLSASQPSLLLTLARASSSD